MSEQKGSTNSYAGIAFAGFLTTVFVTFKLCGMIQWSWWCVAFLVFGLVLFGLATWRIKS